MSWLLVHMIEDEGHLCAEVPRYVLAQRGEL